MVADLLTKSPAPQQFFALLPILMGEKPRTSEEVKEAQNREKGAPYPV
jgi:hypothetical protein